MHAAGLFHEQDRNDRDDYISGVSNSDVPKKMNHETKGIPFDFASLMLYPTWGLPGYSGFTEPRGKVTFESQGSPTIGYFPLASTPHGPSELDKVGLASLYPEVQNEPSQIDLFQQDAWCDSTPLYNSHGSWQQVSIEQCSQKCTADSECKFFSWGFDTYYNGYKCGTFKSCDSHHSYGTGNLNIYHRRDYRAGGGTDWQGNTMPGFPKNMGAQECSKQCTARSAAFCKANPSQCLGGGECRGFMVRQQDNMCWLKNSGGPIANYNSFCPEDGVCTSYVKL